MCVLNSSLEEPYTYDVWLSFSLTPPSQRHTPFSTSPPAPSAHHHSVLTSQSPVPVTKIYPYTTHAHAHSPVPPASPAPHHQAPNTPHPHPHAFPYPTSPHAPTHPRRQLVPLQAHHHLLLHQGLVLLLQLQDGRLIPTCIRACVCIPVCVLAKHNGKGSSTHAHPEAKCVYRYVMACVVRYGILFVASRAPTWRSAP